MATKIDFPKTLYVSEINQIDMNMYTMDALQQDAEDGDIVAIYELIGVKRYKPQPVFVDMEEEKETK